MSKRSYERRIRAKREAQRAARKRAERKHKFRLWSSVAGAMAIAALLLIVFLGGNEKQEPSASPKPLAGCTVPTPAPTPNGKDYTSGPKMTIDKNEIYVATFETSCGNVVMRMDPKTAPASVNNFVFLAREHYFDGTTIPRVQNGDSFKIIQAGSQSGTISGGVNYQYQGETPAPGTRYTRGVVAMANRSGPSTNGSQFFFVLSQSTPGLDQQASFSIFGNVNDASSLSVLDKILTATGPAVDPQQDLGIKPEPPIYILKVTIEEQRRS